jgi:hypothetical protein
MFVEFKHPQGHRYVLNTDHVLVAEADKSLVGITNIQFFNGMVAQALGTLKEVKDALVLGLPISEIK